MSQVSLELFYNTVKVILLCRVAKKRSDGGRAVMLAREGGRERKSQKARVDGRSVEQCKQIERNRSLRADKQ